LLLSIKLLLLLLKLHLLHHLLIIHIGIRNHLLICLIHLLHWNTRLHYHLSRNLWHILLLFHWLRRLLLIWVHFFLLSVINERVIDFNFNCISIVNTSN
jgi:hypothetical protein